MDDKNFGPRLIGGNPGGRRSKADFYPTPPEATQALLDYIQLPPGTRVWEPACGKGDMVRVMESNDLIVRSTDVQLGTDFLTAPPEWEDWIITNPPFSLAAQFIDHCWEIGKPFALLLKTQFWHAQKRFNLFYDRQPSEVLPLGFRVDFTGGGDPLMDVCWNVWRPGERGGTNYRVLPKPTRVWR